MKTVLRPALWVGMMLFAQWLPAQRIYLKGVRADPANISTGGGGYVSSVDAAYQFSFRLDEDKTWQRVGAYGQHIRPYLQEDPQALIHLNKYRNKKLASDIIFGAGIASLTTSIVFFEREIDAKSNPLGTTGLIILCAGGILSWLPAGFLRKSSNADMNAAVVIYNQNQGYVSRIHTLRLRIRPSLGLAAHTPALTAGVSLQFE